LLYWVSDRDGSAEIYSIDQSAQVVQMTHTAGGGNSWAPALGVDRALYFTSDRSGKAEIHRIDADGQVNQITNTPGSAQSWAPLRGAGRVLLFNSDRDGETEIYSLDADGQIVRVTNTPGQGESWISDPTEIDTPASVQSSPATQTQSRVAADVSPQMSAAVRVNANIRSGPGTEFRIVGRASQGDTVVVDGRATSGDWLHTNEGWINASLLDVRGNAPLLRILSGNGIP
jgi:hypothetical protein